MEQKATTGKMFSGKDLRNLIIPLVIEQGLALIVGVVDSMMVSYAGESAMSGVAIADMYAQMINTVLAAIGGGGAVVVSQYIGHRDTDRANHAAGQLLMLGGLIGFFLTFFTIFARGGILRLFYRSVEADVMQNASRYLLVTGFSYLFLGIYNASTALFRSMKKTFHTMMVSILMNVINIIGNAIGIFVLHAGVDGVAVPTLISRIVAGVVMSSLLFSRRHQIFVTRKSVLTWDREYIRRILHIAIPNGIENGLFTLGRMIVTSIVALFGTSQIAASSAALNLGTIAIIVTSGNNLAMVTVIGQCVGAGEHDQAAWYMKRIMRISYIGNIVLTILMELFLHPILRLYSLSPEAMHYAWILVTIHNVGSCFIHPTSFNLANGLRATGDAKYTMMVGLFSMLFFRVGAAALFGIVLHYEVMGVWFAMISDWACRSILFLHRFRSGKWREYKAI